MLRLNQISPTIVSRTAGFGPWALSSPRQHLTLDTFQAYSNLFKPIQTKNSLFFSDQLHAVKKRSNSLAFHVSRITSHASRFTHHVSCITPFRTSLDAELP